MSAWAAKRFWQAASAEPCDGGFTVRLDARPVKTPAKQPLVLPSLAMAQAVATEWDAQHGLIKPDTMPLTRAANSAIDKVAPQFDGVVGEIANYGTTDLLCYRATDPQPLIDRQAAGWGPLLDWARDALGAPLAVTYGVIPISQPAASLARLRDHVAGHSPFHLAALHDLVAISGSLVLGLAVAHQRLTGDQAFGLSRIDEKWQSELWGEDEDAAALEALRQEAFLTAERFYTLCG
ncbi:MAG: ATP12 family protein [Pseudotabrizicola sp.]|uniref:ATP12 family chaperone protein n=1 Tax=Pseudotabrizicola sp. TaxID=2939647 RepID=UPI002728F94A|nr:ATP12 family protein [Pseudotabrizicola sp.]MDO8885232.1 ATP12 family protein [Pseudotabrizicola sp.]MDP2081760.1 ATP12 family protein [Pseudotabrizicola sp.]MDZ7573055.1 ATP12 family protein [Pseudotabrizicola sp.]